MLGADTAQLPDTIRDHYEQAKSEGGANIVFITGIGKVYPYIRAHTLLNALQGRIDDRPLVLFYPGTFTRSASAGRSCRYSAVCLGIIIIVRKICVR